jgi:thioredoxin 1
VSKFGDLINETYPLLLAFVLDKKDETDVDLNPVLKDVAAAIGDKGRVVKIDVEKNNKISDALRIKVLPTLMIYKTGEMVWRQSGEQDANTLIGLMKEYLD